MAATRRKRSRILAPHSKKNQFGDVAKIESDSTPVGPAVFADLVPDEIGLVLETPRMHDGKAFRKKCIWAPKIQMRRRSAYISHR